MLSVDGRADCDEGTGQVELELLRSDALGEMEMISVGFCDSIDFTDGYDVVDCIVRDNVGTCVELLLPGVDIMGMHDGIIVISGEGEMVDNDDGILI